MYIVLCIYIIIITIRLKIHQLIRENTLKTVSSKQTTIKYNFPIFASSLLIFWTRFASFLQCHLKKINIVLHMGSVIGLAESHELMRNGGVTKKRKILYSSSTETKVQRWRETEANETEVEVELAVVWKRQHTRLYGRLLDNRHCAPAITRNRTRQHHAGIVRVSASILLLSHFLSLSLAHSRSSYISFISFHFS